MLVFLNTLFGIHDGSVLPRHSGKGSSRRRRRILRWARIRGFINDSFSTVMIFLGLMQESVLISLAAIHSIFFRSSTVLSLVVINQTTKTQILHVSNLTSVINTQSFVSFTVPDCVPFIDSFFLHHKAPRRSLQLSLDTLIPQLSSLEESQWILFHRYV